MWKADLYARMILDDRSQLDCDRTPSDRYGFSLYANVENHQRLARSSLIEPLQTPRPLVVWLPPGEMRAEIYIFDAQVGGGYRMSLFYPCVLSFIRPDTPRQDLRERRWPYSTIRGTCAPSRIVGAVRFHSADPALSGEMTLEAAFEATDSGTEVTIARTRILPGIQPEDNEAGCRSSLE
jgi:hypothetical protein